MSSLPVFVGLDYHQDSVQVCVLDQQGKQLCNRSVANDAGTIQRVATRHGSPPRIAIEACCGAADLVRVNDLAKVWLAPTPLGAPPRPVGQPSQGRQAPYAGAVAGESAPLPRGPGLDQGVACLADRPGPS